MRHSIGLWSIPALVVLVAGLCPSHLSAQTSYIYANNGDPAKPSYVYQIDLATGAINNTYTNLDPASINGTGVAVVGRYMFYTAATSNCIYQYDLSYGQDLGCQGNITSEIGLGSLAYDGTNFWVVGAFNQVYKCDYNLFNCAVAFAQSCFWPLTCDALEYIRNPAFSPAGLVSKGVLRKLPDSYDVYDLTGGLQSFAYLQPTHADTGVAWSGSNFYTADPTTTPQQLQIYGSPPWGGAPSAFLPLTGIPANNPAHLQDLSIQYSIFELPCDNHAAVVLGNAGYDNGPVNGLTKGWIIDFGSVVSNSFQIGPVGAPETARGFCFVVWNFQGDAGYLYSLTWSITTQPNGGTTIATETADKGSKTLAEAYLFTNNMGFDVSQAMVTFHNPVSLPAGTYYLNLMDATTASGNPTYWDQNKGQGCTSQYPTPGCPSTAYRFDSTCPIGCSIPSESFTLR